MNDKKDIFDRFDEKQIEYLDKHEEEILDFTEKHEKGIYVLIAVCFAFAIFTLM